MEPHTHPDYDETFKRIVNILDVVTQQQDVITQQQLSTERAVGLLARALEQYIAEGRVRDAETTDKLNGLIDLMDRHLREHRDKPS